MTTTHTTRTMQPHSENTISSSPYEHFRHASTYIASPPPYDLPSIMVACFEPLCVSYWQGGGMYLTHGSTATVSGTSYTSCSADVSRCTWGPPTAYSQTMSLMSKSGLWLPTPAHTPRSSPLLHSPTHPTPTYGMWLYVLTLCLTGDCGAFV